MKIRINKLLTPIIIFFILVSYNNLISQDNNKFRLALGGTLSNPEKIIGYDFDMSGWGITSSASYEIYKNLIFIGLQADYLKNQYGLNIDASQKYDRIDYSEFFPINFNLKINPDFGYFTLYVEVFEGFVFAKNKTDYFYYGNKFARDNGTASTFQNYGIGGGATLKLGQILNFTSYYKNLDFFIEMRRLMGRNLKAYDAILKLLPDNNFYVEYNFKETSFVLNLLTAGLSFRF